MNQHFCFYCMSPVNEDGTCPVCGLTAGAYQPAPHHIPPGTILMNRYLIGRVLGEGGFGITYIACDLRLDLKVAIKEYFPTDKATRHASSSLDVTCFTGAAGSDYESAKRKFLSEARVMAKMDKQPEVVGVRDFFEVNNTAYIVMEFVDGTTFRELVKQEGGKIPAKKLLSTIEPLFDALSAVHAAGLVHRDISPDNLMLEHGKVRLLDFGCARESSHGTNTLTIALKHGYAPIEQYTNHGQGPWTDIYALAATIYFCLTGKAPVRSTDRLLGDELILPSKLGVDLTRQQEKALLRALSIQPRRRFQTMEEFHAALYAPEEDPILTPEEDAENIDPILEPIDSIDNGEAPPAQEPSVQEPTVQEPTVIPAAPEKTVSKAPKHSQKRGMLGILAGILAVILLIVGILLWPDSDVETPTQNLLTNTVSGKCGLDVKWELDLDTGEMELSGAGKMYDYDYADGITTTPWEEHRDKITSLTVGDSVSEIGNWAFAFCENLTDVHLGAGVELLNVSAFDHSGIVNINLGEGLKEIQGNALSGTLLENVTLPESLEYLGYTAFEDCPNLKKVTIPGEATRLNFDTWHNSIFSNGGAPSEITLCGYTNSMVEEYARIKGHTFQSIGVGGWEAVGQCGDSLNWYLDLDSGFLKITGNGKMYDFNGSWQLDPTNDAPLDPSRTYAPWENYREQIFALSIGDGVTSIGENAFENCHNLTDVHWGNSLETIKSQAFLSSNIDELWLPDSVNDIAYVAFNYCQNLRQVVLPAELEVLELSVFNQCLNLEEIYIGRKTTLSTHGVETPFNQDVVTADGRDERKMPANMTIYSLQNSDAERFASEYGIPFEIGVRGMGAEYQGQCGDDAWWFADRDSGTLVLYGTGSTWMYNLSSADIAGWAKEEYENGRAFTAYPKFRSYNHWIRSIIVLPGLETLGNGLFVDMTLVKSIDFGTVVECRSHMRGCNGLKEVVFPETVEFINSWLFYGCYNLESVTIPNGSKGIDPMIFYSCHNLTSVTFGPKAKIMDTKEENLFSSNSYASKPNSNLIFYVTKGSDAERYAKQYGINYEYYE